MKSLPQPCFERAHRLKQRGLVLFFALIALVALSLAAVALIRSVDTSTLIAGNLAFKQAATTSGDAGVEAAVSWLEAQQLAATQARVGTNNNVLNDSTHPFNITSETNGYYTEVSTVSTAALFTDAPWAAITAIPETTDGSGNRIRYIIQRMCRTSNQVPTTANCLFSGAFRSTSGQEVKLPQEVCTGTGCPVAGQAPQIRVTTRTIGPRNTVSYVQAFVY